MTVESASSTSSRFSEELKSMTWDDHEHAEYTEYMQALLGGQLTIDGYTDMVAQHYFAYLVIEDAAEKLKDNPVAAPFIFDELARKEALETDLAYLLGADWADQIKPNEATNEYCARMREKIYDWPGGFVAHAYTRYLGDLSGGQVIKAAVERAFDLKDHQGVQFYVFDKIPDYKQFKIDYRDRLDSAPWGDAEQDQVIAEAVEAYRLNTKVLAEIGRDLPRYLKN